jgi:hypothetical protein
MRHLVALLLLLPLAARAQPAPQLNANLYQATALVTGTDMRQRPLGFALTLTEVLVKITGQPGLRSDPRLPALLETADQSADSYTYLDPRAGLLHHDDQGTYDRTQEMTVRYNPAKIQALLDSLNLKAWTAPRPLITPILIVRSREPTAFLLSAENPRGAEYRIALTRLAAEHGLGIHFPSESELAAWAVTLTGFPAPLNTPGPDRLVIADMLNFDVHELGWVGTWRAGEVTWRIAGVGYDQAFADLMRGAALLASGNGKP